MRFMRKPEPVYIDTQEGLGHVMNKAARLGKFAYDTETTLTQRTAKKREADIIRDHAVMWSLSTGTDRYAFPAWLLPAAAPIFEDPYIEKIGHNERFDRHILRNHKIQVLGPISDTMHMYWLYDESLSGRYALKTAGWDLLQIKSPTYKELFGLLKDIREAPLDKAADYASNDAWETFQIYLTIKRLLVEDYNEVLRMSAWEYYCQYERPFTDALFEMECNGIRYDENYFTAVAPRMEAELKHMEEEIIHEIGHYININSSQQLAKYFYEERKYRVKKYTDGGSSGIARPSVNEVALQKLITEGDPVAAKILEHRGMSKLLSTYIKGLAAYIGPDGRIHPSAKVTLATGRISLSPGLQTIPNPHKDEIFKLRTAFIPDAGKDLHAYDYEQLEMRIMAICANDSGMIKNILSGKDIHALNAALMFQKSYDDIRAAKKADPPTLEQKGLLRLRDQVKAIGFGINYLMGPSSLAVDLKCSVLEAKEKMEAYFRLYPELQAFIERSIEHGRVFGKVVTPFLGRNRRILHLESSRGSMRHHEESVCVNTQIQGGAADWLRLAMIDIHRDKHLRAAGVKMILQVHDELLFEVDEKLSDEIMPYIKHKMEHPLGWESKVPLPVSCAKAKNWYAAK